MEYKGHRIDLNEKTGEFVLIVDSENYFRSTNLIEVKNTVDKLVKKTFKRIPAYVLGEVGYHYGHNEKTAYTEVEVTSISPDGDIWIIDKKKNRQKNPSRMFKRNAENLATLNTIKIYKQEIAAIEKKIDDWEKKLEPIKLPETKSDE